MPDLLKSLIFMAMFLCLGCDDDDPVMSATDGQIADIAVEDAAASDGGVQSDAMADQDASGSLDVGLVDGGQEDGAVTNDAMMATDAFILPDGALDLGTGDAEPRGENRAALDTPPSGGAQMDGTHLEALARDGAFLHFPPQRMTPRVPELGDTSDFQPWFVYRHSADEPWGWLIMAIFLPDGEAARVPDNARRLLIGRTGPWRAGPDGTVVTAGTTAARLAQQDAEPVCGRAVMGARFELVLPNGERIPNALALIQFVSPEARFDMGWLRGCRADILP